MLMTVMMLVSRYPFLIHLCERWTRTSSCCLAHNTYSVIVTISFMPHWLSHSQYTLSYRSIGLACDNGLCVCVCLHAEEYFKLGSGYSMHIYLIKTGWVTIVCCTLWITLTHSVVLVLLPLLLSTSHRRNRGRRRMLYYFSLLIAWIF